MSPSLTLIEPARPLLPTVSDKLRTVRYWERFPDPELEYIANRISTVLDDRNRQGNLLSLFDEGAAPAASLEAPAAAPASKNETLGAVLSPSQANMFLNCSAKWWFKYGAGLPDPAGGSFVRGRAVHQVIERWYKLQLAGADPAIDDMGEVYEDAWEAGAADAAFGKDEDIEALKASGARLLRKYLDEVAPSIHPAKLEQRVAGEIGGVRVQGYIDIVDTDGRIVDVKTAEKSPAGVSGDYAFQLATYRQLLPESNGQARLDTLVNNKTPKIVTMEYEVTAADQLLTCNLYPRVREGIREGLYFPNRSANLCSRKYCNFADACCREFGGCVD